MTVVPYKADISSKKDQVAKMFNNISRRYDFLNHFLSVGIDVIWRREAIKLLQEFQPKNVLDVATGTGDFAIEALKINPEKIVGVDISEGMLSFGQEKIKKMGLEKTIQLQKGDSERLPF
jgi:demethylmenaquinone methyltransferase/2-methoxy-6-polyprenyl-1,4-benzoquinol methylase